jgi:small subunit ribosomal protein S6
MRTYELVLVLKASLSETQQKKLTDAIKTWLGDAKIAKSDDWGKKPLSYPIKKEVAGVYLDWHLDTGNSIPQDFEKKLLNNDDILRHLLIRRK